MPWEKKRLDRGADHLVPEIQVEDRVAQKSLEIEYQVTFAPLCN